MKLFKPKFWHDSTSLLSFFLLPLAFIYQFLIIIKNNFTKKEKFTIPIICVGNIYLGGTGKTPLCIEISKILTKLNKKNAIVKKFYKEHEDEFKLIESKKIKLFKSKYRSSSIKKATSENFDCVILDDGLQDSSVIKDLSIICFNEGQLAGNEKTLPSGPLREPLSSIKNSQIVVITGKENKIFEEKIKLISKNTNIYYANYSPTNIDLFQGRNLLAFAGIGNPNNFFSILENNNLKISRKIFFPDHYDYSTKELNDIVEYSIKNNLKIVTTEKDYFRIRNHNISQIQYLNVKFEIKEKDKFEKKIIECLY